MSERHQLVEHYGGWTPSRPDHRRRHTDPSGIKVLPEVDPRNEFPSVFDQFKLGTCTANEAASSFEYDAFLDGLSFSLSRLWIYWQERKLENNVGHGDTGAMGHDAYRAATSIGICAEKDWPYDPARYNDPAYFDPPQPPSVAVQDEGYYRLRKPYGIPPRTQLAFQQVLSNRQTIGFGFSVYESFESAEVARTGIVPIPQQDEQQVGGHRMLVVGYLKSEPHYALVRNSWGKSWGITGYCLFPWQYILDPNLSGDWTTIQRPIGK